MSNLRISFYGDDFTGSTDAMESLARSGLRTVLFTQPPTAAHLAKYPHIQAFGVAGMTRAMPPAEMEQTLRPAFAAMKQTTAPIVHYKVCSTFDSSPTVGSIGRAIDVGADVFASRFVPVVVGAPPLGRYCVFGNLFARCGAESEPHRLDRHPSMSRHPITPMDEADLRVHLAKQTSRTIGLLDVLQLAKPQAACDSEFDRIVANGAQVVLVDLLHEDQLAAVGRLLDRCDKPLFIAGSSGVEMALVEHWRQTGVIAKPAEFQRPGDAGAIVAVCGSCSPVTAGQIRWATANGFAEVPLDVQRLDQQRAIADAVRSIGQNRSVVIHTTLHRADRAIDSSVVGAALGEILRGVLDSTSVRRVIVAGGDTSGQVARLLGIESMEMVAELTRGAPLCKVSAPHSPADGMEITFKGGQIGPEDFFGLVLRGPRI